MFQLLDGLLMLLQNAILAVVSAALTAGVAWLVGKIKNDRLKNIVGKVDDLALLVVRSTYQAYVKPLQTAGAWTPSKHIEAKQAAIAELKSYLGPKGLVELQKVIDGDLASFLGAAVEEAVYNNKLFGAAMKAAPSPLPASAQG